MKPLNPITEINLGLTRNPDSEGKLIYKTLIPEIILVEDHTNNALFYLQRVGFPAVIRISRAFIEDNNSNEVKIHMEKLVEEFYK